MPSYGPVKRRYTYPQSPPTKPNAQTRTQWGAVKRTKRAPVTDEKKARAAKRDATRNGYTVIVIQAVCQICVKKMKKEAVPLLYVNDGTAWYA